MRDPWFPIAMMLVVLLAVWLGIGDTVIERKLPART
jgi:hypothetical protein